MLGQIAEIQNLATKYSKSELGRMVQLGTLDPAKAMMAGMMIQRIEQQNAQPPQTTVAQDVLGMPPVPNQPQQAQAPQQAAPGGIATPQAQPSPGVAALPSGIKKMASGGIVAFDEGGEVPGYNGESRWGSMVGGSGFVPGAENQQTFSLMQQSAANAQAETDARKAEYQARVQVIQDKLSRGESLTPAEATLANYNKLSAPTSPFPISSDNEMLARRQQGVGSLTTPWVDATKSNGIAANGVPPTTAPAIPSQPALPSINSSKYKVDIPVGNLPIPEARTADQAGDIRREQEKKEGYDPEMYNKIIAGIEAKKGDVATEKDHAIGEAIMQAGFKLMGARKGQEFQNLSEGAQEGLKSYSTAMKELKARQDKLDERTDAFRIADAQARKTNAASDIASAEKRDAERQAAEGKVFEAKNSAAEVGAQVGAHIYGSDVQAIASMRNADVMAQTHRYTAELSNASQKEYNLAVKQGQLDANIAKIMLDAENNFMKNNAMNYINKPNELAAAAREHALSAAKQYLPGASIAGGATPSPAAGGNRRSLDAFQQPN